MAWYTQFLKLYFIYFLMGNIFTREKKEKEKDSML